MQTVLLLLANGASAIGSAASGIGAAVGGAGSGILNGLRVGTSAISALSSFAQGRAQQQADNQAAAGEQMNARAELINAQERSNAISQAFNATVAQQMAVTSASGIDLGSGSVQAARTQAQSDADRQLTIIRNGADMNAALRRGRAASLVGAGQDAAQAGLIKGLTDFGGTLMDLKQTGKYSPKPAG